MLLNLTPILDPRQLPFGRASRCIPKLCKHPYKHLMKEPLYQGLSKALARL